MIFDKTVKNITRIGEVINILVRFGFEDVVSNTALKKFISTRKQITGFTEKPISDFNRWERIRMVIEELGTTFIKLAQVLSNRPDILPAPLIEEFSLLQSKVPPFSTKKAKQIIEKETGKKINEIFSYFDNRTIGAGSIGQVHRAKLKRDEDVVVKVQRPDAPHKVRTDLLLLREFIKLTENYFNNLGILNPIDIVNTFEETMLQELDYKNEALNMMRFRRAYGTDKSFYVPKPYTELSSSKILVIEFTAGCEVNDVKQLSAWGINTKEIAEKVTAVFFKQIFERGIFHADPHPGNILIKPDKQIVLIDFGMTGKLTKRRRFDFSGVILSVANANAKSLAGNLKKLAVNGEVRNMKSFENDLENLIDDFIILDIGESGISELIARLRKIVYNYKLRIPGEIFLILRAVAILEGICRKLHPNFKIIEFIMPYSRKMVREQYTPGNMRDELNYSLAQVISMLYSSPNDIKYILKKIRKGELHSNIFIKGLEPLVKKMDTIANRFVLSLLISSLLISSAIIMTTAPEGMKSFFGMPIASVIGFAGALFWSLWLFFYVLRHSKDK